MGGTRRGRLRLRFCFPLRGFGVCFGSSRRTLDLRGRMDKRRRRRLRFGRYRSLLRNLSRLPLAETAAKLQRNLVVQGAGVRLLLRDAKLRQQIEDDVGLDFELASQLIDANFTHTGRPGANFLAPGFQPLYLSFPEPHPAYWGSGDSVFSILTDSFSGSAGKSSMGGSSAAASPAATASAALSSAGASSPGGTPAGVSTEPSNWP